jgi:D-alanyl-D-alanine dipeptidase
MPKIRRAEDLFWPTPGHPVETIDNLDRIPIVECGEPLIRLADACPELLLRPMGPFGRTERKILWSRQSVADRLTAAQLTLGERRPGARLIVVDAWRSPERQVQMHRVARFIFRCRYPTLPAHLIREAANKYVATPDALAPPPHSTGGAVDLRVQGPDGRDLPMGAASRTADDRVTGAARKNRALLCAAMEAAGFSNYEEEWWHWSYGDSGWALRSNQPMALYAKIRLPS